MEGGINAWNGMKATGLPNAGMAYFSDKDKPEDIIALAWFLEEGARRFYRGVEDLMKDQETKEIFKSLVADEVRHKALLSKLYKEIAVIDDGPELSSVHTDAELTEVMESGMRIKDALKWAEGKDIKDILDYSIAMETNSYDLYLKMERTIERHDLKKVFRALADEEKIHLDKLTSLLDKEAGKRES